MDTSDLFASCRKGDVGRVRYLVEQQVVEVNVWDRYYPCLCGHEELVLYLLVNGAHCEANIFQGERCLYGAASDNIRRVLRDYKQVTASCRRWDYYNDFLQRLLDQGIHSNVVFVVHGKPFQAHCCILGARSAYFANMLDIKWKGKSIVVLRHPLINPVAFGALLQYLYTGFLDVGVEHISDRGCLAKQCQLLDLLSDLEAKCKEVSEFMASKPGTYVQMLSVRLPPEDPRLREDLALLADCALPPELRALLNDHFQENEGMEASGSLLAVTLHSLSPNIFTHVLYFIHTDHTERSPALRRLSPACSLWPSKVWTRAEHVVSSNTEYNYLTHSLCGWEGTGAPRGSL